MQVTDWKGKRIIFSGRIKQRSHLEAKLERLGAKVSGRVTSRVTCLVAGPNSGAKLAMARSLKVAVITEQQLESLLNGLAIVPTDNTTKKRAPAMATNKSLSQLRELLHEDSSKEGWKNICGSLDKCSSDTLEMAVDYINQTSAEVWGGVYASFFDNLSTAFGDNWGIPQYFTHHIFEPRARARQVLRQQTTALDFRVMPLRWQKELTRGEFSPKFEVARILGFYGVKINVTIARAILSCPNLSNIEALFLDSRKLSKGWARDFARSDTFPNLKHLDVSGSYHLQLAGVEAICSSDKHPGLKYLGLSQLSLDDLPTLPSKLEGLDLSRNTLDWTDSRLQDTLKSGQLRRLSLSEGFHSEQAFLSLLESGALDSLEVLFLADNHDLGQEARRALVRRMHDGRLRPAMLNAQHTNMTSGSSGPLWEACEALGVGLLA